MKTGTHSNSQSPVSSSGAPVRSRQKTVAIARSQGSGYERPERARTSHACEPCRERKTKCDGERPSCRRCLHTGTSCHYGYGKGWKKRKTAEDLTVTSKRLARYESLLNDIMPLVEPKVQAMIETVRQQETSLSNTPDALDSNTSISNHLLDGEYQSTSPNLSRLPLPVPATSPGAPTFPSAPRSVPPPPVIDPNPPGLQTHASHSSMRISPTDESGGIRLPSITRHGVLLEDSLRQLGNSRSTGSAPDLMSKSDSLSPGIMPGSLPDGMPAHTGPSKSHSHD